MGTACLEFETPPVRAIRPVVARFDASSLEGTSETAPRFLDVPFPSVVYMDETTGRFRKIPGLELTFKRGADHLNAQLERVNGWSRIAPALFIIDDLTAPPRDPDTLEKGSAKIDRESLPADEKACTSDGSSVFLLDLDATDPSAARVPCRAIYHDESGDERGRSILGIGPARGVVLREGGNYLAVLTSRVKDVRGFGVTASKDFEAAAVRGEGPLGSVYKPFYDKAMSLVGGALGSDTIVSLAPYRTQKVADEIYAVRDEIEAAPAPTLRWDEASLAPMAAAKFAAKTDTLPDGFTASLDDWLGVRPTPAKLPDGTDDPDDLIPVIAHDKIAAFGTAVFEATNWLQVRDKKYDDVEHATFARDGSGKIVPSPDKPTNKIWVSFAIPNTPMPAEGYPAVIFQHGLGGSRHDMLPLANRFCSKGWIAVAIDSVTFGARANDPKFLVDQGTDYASAPGVTYTGPDGLADAIGDARERAGSFDLFGGLRSLGALRDQLRQAALDTVQLVKLLRSNPDLSPLATGSPPVVPKIDPERIAYVGNSLGGIEGAVAAAIEPHVKAWVLNVAGGGLLSEIAAHGPAINAQLSLAGGVNFGFGATGQYDEGHVVVTVAQTLGEGGDPIAYADKLVKSPMPLAGTATKARNVLLTEVVFDELVANEGTEALARAAGFGLASPNVGPNAGLADLASRTPYRGGGIELTLLPEPGADGYRDTPQAGVTALLAQLAPAQHGANLVRSSANRSYEIPYNTKEGGLSLELHDGRPVPCPYRELQDTILRFFEDAFEGKVPAVVGLPTPTRDTDGDGVLDDADREPTNPTVK